MYWDQATINFLLMLLAFALQDSLLSFAHAQVRNYFVAAGMNSNGIANAGGYGRALAEWIADGKMNLSLSLSSILSFPSSLSLSLPSPGLFHFHLFLQMSRRTSL